MVVSSSRNIANRSLCLFDNNKKQEAFAFLMLSLRNSSDLRQTIDTHENAKKTEDNAHILVHAKLVDLRIQGLDVDLNGRLLIISWLHLRTASPVRVIISHPTQQTGRRPGSGAEQEREHQSINHRIPTNNPNAQVSRGKAGPFR